VADALIGSTGFVGGNLLRQARFDDLFSSRNIESIAGRSYDLIVCAGAPAVKWKANRDPEADRASLARLTGALKHVKARKVILISTVDVYPSPIEVDEATAIPPAAGSPYGRHRLALEGFVAERFDSLVVRLPALFGDGLKKNVVYDLLHGNMLDRIHSEGVFQFYGLDGVWADVQRCSALGLKLVNLATEPVSVRELAREAFDMDFSNVTQEPPARYDFRTRYDHLLGGARGYIRDRARVLGELRAFVERERGRVP
jgi:nucleoside-diphosphate-sugar epimerase